MHTKKSKLVIILLCLLFISVAYNVWWVGFERSSNEETIEELNTYIEMSRDVLVSMTDVAEQTTDYSNIATEALIRCGDGDLSNAEETAKTLANRIEEIEILKTDVRELIKQRTEYAESTGLVVSYGE